MTTIIMDNSGEDGKEKLPGGEIFLFLKSFVSFLSVFCLFLCCRLKKYSCLLSKHTIKYDCWFD